MSHTSSLMSIRELIDTAFGDENTNVVNHKLVQTILVILARQLRILERRVEVEIGPLYGVNSSTSLSVTEIKIHANVPRKRKIKQISKKSSTKSNTGTSNKPSTTHDKIAKPTVPNKPAKSSDTPEKSSKSKIGDVSTTMKSIAEETPIDRSIDQSSFFEKSSTSKSYSIKTDKISDKSTDKSANDKTAKEKEKSTEKALTDKLASVAISSLTTKETTIKISSDKKGVETSSSAKKSMEKSSSAVKSSDGTISGKFSGADYLKWLEKIEEKRETELRVIHQRADSREEPDKTPKPMTSLDSIEKQYEKILLVERVPADQAKRIDSHSPHGAPRLSVVTQEEFEKLVTAVNRLQERFGLVATPNFPDNAQLLHDLRRGASLTEAMAVLQLSARINATEQALEKMLGLVTKLASNTPGVTFRTDTTTEVELMKEGGGEKETEVIIEAEEAPSSKTKKSAIIKDNSQKSKQGTSKESLEVFLLSHDEISQPDLQVTREVRKSNTPHEDYITAEELSNAIKEINDELLKMVNSAIAQSKASANNAIQIADRLEKKLDTTLNLGERMNDLENMVSEYADQINALDTGLSSQMTNYQEQLTQMQHDVEAGVETMQEALANTGGDTAAVGELNNHFTNLQMDFDVALSRQKDLKDVQDTLAMNLQDLWKQIEILRDSKSDRDEVTDALRDKAGLEALNGLVSRQEFDAVRGDFETRIMAAYDKFNNQENVWQKAIDDIIRDLNEKADYIQIVSLKESINKYLQKFQNRLHEMMKIVGEPRAAAISRILHRDATCLSCSSPAHMEIESKAKLILPASRPLTIGAKDKPSEDGDHGVCYPGLPIPNSIDPRSHMCHRYCGGSHTLINNAKTRVPEGIVISPVLHQVNTEIGCNGKIYLTDDIEEKKPCLPCNSAKNDQLPHDSGPSINEANPPLERKSSGMTPPDYFASSLQYAKVPVESEVSSTPPPAIYEE